MSTYIPPSEVYSSGQSNIGALFHCRVAANPAQAAVVHGDRRITYAELEDRSNRLANAFIAAGLEPGDRVALLARNCAEYPEVELAAAKSGIIMAALNWRLADRELTHCITLVQPRMIILQPEFSDALVRIEIEAGDRLTLGDEYEQRLAASPGDYPDYDIDPEDGLVILYTSGTTGLPKGAL
ncbi:MAG: AMP-binding protein, partial [Pseudomonadales bacterium]|nr:AMP-binding protein [Pseudomonadales bacterium]